MILEMASRRAAVVADLDLDASLALARAGTDQALAIVRDLKMLSREPDERKEAVDLPALLDAAFGLAGATLASKARVVRRYGPTPLAFGSPSRLTQVFLDLLSNAADAIPEGAPSRHEIGATTRTDARGRAVVEIHDKVASTTSPIHRDLHPAHDLLSAHDG